jgi:hypothetical protein
VLCNIYQQRNLEADGWWIITLKKFVAEGAWSFNILMFNTEIPRSEISSIKKGIGKTIIQTENINIVKIEVTKFLSWSTINKARGEILGLEDVLY